MTIDSIGPNWRVSGYLKMIAELYDNKDFDKIEVQTQIVDRAERYPQIVEFYIFMCVHRRVVDALRALESPVISDETSSTVLEKLDKYIQVVKSNPQTFAHIPGSEEKIHTLLVGLRERVIARRRHA